MIKAGSTIILLTENAIYSPCEVVKMSEKNITITYLSGTKRDKNTGEIYNEKPVETISKNTIIKMSERLQ